MIQLERDGSCFLLTMDAGLNAFTLRLTANEFAHLIEHGRALLFPAPAAPVGPDEEVTA